MSHRLGGPVAPVLGVIRGTAVPPLALAYAVNAGRVVVLTKRNLYVMRARKVLVKEPIESVSLGLYSAPSHTTLTVGEDEIHFFFQRRRAVEMMDAVASAQGNAPASSTSRPS
jgi:hypothetical protein